MAIAPSTALLVEILVGLILVALASWHLARRLSRPAPGTSPPQAGDGPVAKYHPAIVVIHWFIAFAMAQLLIRGAFIMVTIPNTDPAKIDALRAHMLAGVLVLILMVARVILRNTTRLPRPAFAPTPFLDRLKRFVHPLLYVAIFVQASAGLGMAFEADLPRVLFSHEGALPADFWVYSLRSVHYVVSRLLMLLITIHICGALYHTLILRDGLIRRMGLGRRDEERSRGEAAA